MKVEVYAPSDYAGDLMGDLNGRRGRISGMDTRGATTVIRAQVPMAEMLTYEQHLTSATGGRGSYHMEYSHYDEVPRTCRRRSSRPPRRSARGRGRRGLKNVRAGCIEGGRITPPPHHPWCGAPGHLAGCRAGVHQPARTPATRRTLRPPNPLDVAPGQSVCPSCTLANCHQSSTTAK